MNTKYKFIEEDGINVDSIETRKMFNIGKEVNELKECLKSEGVDLNINTIIQLIETIIRNCGVDSNKDKKMLNSVIGLISIKSPYTLAHDEEEEKICNATVIDYLDYFFINNSDNGTIYSNAKIIYDEVCTFINDLFDYIYTKYIDDYNDTKKMHNNAFVSHHYIAMIDQTHILEFDVYGEASINKPVIHIVGTTIFTDKKKCELVIPSFGEEDRKILMAKYMNTADLTDSNVEG